MSPNFCYLAYMDRMPQPAAARLVSLDVFRGATMALMVLVNTPGDGAHSYGQLQHAEWNGWTLTDTVFPSFLWIVGVAITLSLGKRMAAGDARGHLFAQVLRRAAILYALGLVVYAYPFSLSTQRCAGVLQRIAICYLIASVYLSDHGRARPTYLDRVSSRGLLAHHEVGSGSRLWRRRPCRRAQLSELYRPNRAGQPQRIAGTRTWDPEGIVSTIPAIATALFGILAGHILRMRRQLSARAAWLLGSGAVLIALGLIASIWLPINKKLWTSSYALLMAGLDFAVFAICLWLVDVRGFQRAVKPLTIMGMNAITVYMISELLDEALGALHWRGPLYRAVFVPLASPMNASLLYAAAYTALLWLIAYGMYRRGWFWRV